MARERGKPPYGARESQSNLADVVRNGDRGNGRGFRHPGISAVAPRTARLAGYGICRVRMGPEGAHSPDSDIEHLQAVFGNIARARRTGSEELASGPRAALSCGGGD